MVQLQVLFRDTNGFWVDVQCYDSFGAEFCRGNCQDSRAGAHIQKIGMRQRNVSVERGFTKIYAFQSFQAEPACGVRAGAEGHTRINLKDYGVLGRVPFFPGGLDNDTSADAGGLKVFFPVIGPVFFLKIEDIGGMRRKAGI